MATAGPSRVIDFDSESILKELSEKGVTVVPNVLTPTECDLYIARYRSWLDKVYAAGLELDSRKSLIQSYRIGHFDTTWEVRLKTRPVFEKLWKTEKLLTSADAIAISKPPEDAIFCDCTAWFVWDLVGNPEDRFSHIEAHFTGSGDYAMPDEDWLHLDQGAQRQGLHAYQGAVYLEETTDTDHCFRVLENSHNFHTSFFEKFPRAVEKTEKLEFCRINKTQKSWYKSRGCNQIKVPCPKGGMILWDSRTIHDNCKPEFARPNKDRWRFVVFVSMTPAIWATPEDIAKKYDAYEKLLITTHWSSQGITTFKPYNVKKREKSVSIEELPDVAKSAEVKLLFGVEPYDFEDGQPNGPPEPQWK